MVFFSLLSYTTIFDAIAPIAIGLLSSDGGQLGYQKAVGCDMAITETVPLV